MAEAHQPVGVCSARGLVFMAEGSQKQAQHLLMKALQAPGPRLSIAAHGTVTWMGGMTMTGDSAVATMRVADGNGQVIQRRWPLRAHRLFEIAQRRSSEQAATAGPVQSTDRRTMGITFAPA